MPTGTKKWAKVLSWNPISGLAPVLSLRSTVTWTMQLDMVLDWTTDFFAQPIKLEVA